MQRPEPLKRGVSQKALSLLNLNASVEIRQSIGVKYACFDIFYDAEAEVSTMFVKVSSVMCNRT